MGVIIALQGARRLAAGDRDRDRGRRPGHVADRALAARDTVGASGVVFGYATYLFARGFFNRSMLELLIGAVVVGGGLGRRAAVEPRAPRRRLLAGARVRRRSAA